MAQIHFENVIVVMDNKNILYRYHQHLFSDKYNNKPTVVVPYMENRIVYIFYFYMSLNFFHKLFFLCLSGIDICQKKETTASFGRITSPWHPGKYPSYTWCTITIRQPLDTKITFTFAEMDIEAKGTYLTCSIMVLVFS